MRLQAMTKVDSGRGHDGCAGNVRLDGGASAAYGAETADLEKLFRQRCITNGQTAAVRCATPAA